MAIKKLLFLLIMLLLFSVVWAQDSDYFLEMRFMQRLTWTGDAYALRYEVIIEREDGGVYRELMREFTNEFFLEVSLAPGKYRYRVIPYDFLEQPNRDSGLIEFEVLPAHSPRLLNYEIEQESSEVGGHMLVSKLTINILARNVDDRSVISLKTNDGTAVSASSIELLPSRTQGEGVIKLVFNNPYLVPEVFIIAVVNPGGMETSMSINVNLPPPPPSVKKAVDVFLTAAWLPMFVTYGDIDWLTKQSILPGAAIRLGFIFNNLELDVIDIGTEVSASWLNDESPMWAIDVNLLAQKLTLNEKMAFRFRLGAGYGFLQSFDWMSAHMNIGGSFLFNVWKQMFIEIGIDSVYWYENKDNKGSLRPWVGMGWRF